MSTALNPSNPLRPSLGSHRSSSNSFLARLDSLVKRRADSDPPKSPPLRPSARRNHIDSAAPASQQSAPAPLPASQVEFLSIRESPLNTIGNGNLTLDAILGDIPDTTSVTSRGKGLVRRMSRLYTTSSPVAAAFPREHLATRSDSPDTPRRSFNPLRRRTLSSGVSPTPPPLQLGHQIIADSLQAGFLSNRLRSSLGTTSDVASDVDDLPNDDGTDPDGKYAPERRDRAFHQLFRKIPKSERLLSECSCALSKDILVHGRMYLTSNNICFNSNILGWVTNLVIPLSEVIQIEKKSTAVLFPNGIVVRTLHHKYVFATFLSRDAVFDLVVNIWRRCLHALLHLSHERVLCKGGVATRSAAADGSPLVVTSDDEDDGDSQAGSLYEEDEYDLDADALDLDDSLGSGKLGQDSVKLVSLEALAVGESGDAVPAADQPPPSRNRRANTESEIPTAGPSKHAPTEFEYTKEPNDVFIADEVLKAPLGTVFSILFGTDTAYYLKVLQHQKNFDISALLGLGLKNKERSYSYTKPLAGPIGPKQTRCNITDKLCTYDLEKYVLVEQIAATPDVPSGSSFKIKTRIYLAWAAANCTRMYVVTLIEWLSKSWIKGAIEKGSIDGQKAAIKSTVEAIEDMLQGGNSKGGSRDKASKRRSRQNTRSRKNTLEEDQVNGSRASSKESAAEPGLVPHQAYQLLVLVGEMIPIRIPFLDQSVLGLIILLISAMVALSSMRFCMSMLGFQSTGRSTMQLEFVPPGQVLKRVHINGQPYVMIPEIGTHLEDEQTRLRNERSLWAWLEEKSGNRLHVEDKYDGGDLKQNVVDAYAKQEQREVVDQIQMRINRLKQELEKEMQKTE